MQYRILTESDAEEYQRVRLRALTIASESFGSTYEKEVVYTLDMVKDRIRPTQDKFVLGAFNEGVLVGIATFVRNTGKKDCHKGNIYGMFVAPEMRGRQVGKTILLELIELVKNEVGLEQLHLAVVSTNEGAKRLYQSIGFKTYGVEPNALKDDGKYYDEDLMVLFLNELGK